VLIAVAVTLTLAPQLLGGVFGWGLAIITATVAALALGLAVDGRSRRRRDGRLSWGIVLALLTPLAATFLQLLPWPAALTEALQPRAVEEARTVAQALGEDPPAAVALTLSPGGTRAAVLHTLAALTALLVGVQLTNARRRDVAVRAVGLSAGVMAAVALVHAVVGAEAVFGVYVPRQAASPFRAPLMNPNHLAGFLALGAPALVGLGLDRHENTSTRAVSLVTAVIVAATALACGSRGGALALGVGGLVLVAGAVRRRRAEGARSLAALLGGGAVAVALALYGARSDLEQLQDASLGKLELAREGLILALDHPLVGVGRGAFSAAFVLRHGTDQRFTHPENLIAQWTSEWGLWVGGFAVLVAAGLLLRGLRRARSWPHIGAAAGLVGLAAHEMVDFATERAGVAVVAALLLGAVAGRRSEAGRAGAPVRVVSGGLALAALLAVAVLGPWLDGQRVPTLQSELAATLDGPREEFREILERALALHPAEPAFYLLAGAEAVRHQDPAAGGWLNLAMSRAPGWSAPHVEAARWLAQQGRVEQALLELREAETRMPGQDAVELACATVRTPESLAALLRVAGDEHDGWLDRLGRCLPTELAAAVDERLLERGRPSARLRVARRRLRAGEAAEALLLLAPLEATDPDVALLGAEVLLALGRPAEAASQLAEIAGEETADQRALHFRLAARAAAAAGDLETVRGYTTRLRGMAGGRASELARYWVFQGRLEEEVGDLGAARESYRRADGLDRRSDGLVALARLLTARSEHGAAARAWGELCARQGEGSSACQRAERLRGGRNGPGLHPLLP
jgi:tetratricopeptide (TPR) repeat protein